MIRIKYIIVLLFSILMLACFEDEVDENLVVNGLRPVYGVTGVTKRITIGEAEQFTTPGRIVYRKPYLFINELDKGFHIIDNSNPANPQNIAFVSIPFNKDLAVKGDYVYANNDLDLISLKIISRDSIQLISRIHNAFDGVPLLPPDYNGYFECVDPAKGEVIGWEPAVLTNPKCRK